jgi:transcriptional regulator with GAF, ATPase, and Fis domain
MMAAAWGSCQVAISGSRHFEPYRTSKTRFCVLSAPLADHFLARHGRAEHKRGCRLSPEALHTLEAHRWPGNARELENETQRALVLAEPGEVLTVIRQLSLDQIHPRPRSRS